MKHVVAYTIAALTFICATAAMAAFSAPVLLQQLDQGQLDSVLFASYTAVLF